MIKKKILCFGEVLFDLFPDRKKLGGAPANYTFRLNQLGNHASLCSRVGNDENGSEARRLLEQHEMDLSLFQTDPEKPTGSVIVKPLSPTQIDFTIVKDVAYDDIELTKELIAAVESADALYFGTLVQRAPKTRQTLQELWQRAAGIPKICDINLRRECYNAETILESLQNADVVKLNEEETSVLAKLFGLPPWSYQECAAYILREMGAECVVVTRGENGAYAVSKEQPECSVDGFQVDIADTVGAGDNFTAAFSHGWLQDMPLKECLALGNYWGALATMKEGGFPVITREDEERLQGKNVGRSFGSAYL